MKISIFTPPYHAASKISLVGIYTRVQQEGEGMKLNLVFGPSRVSSCCGKDFVETMKSKGPRNERVEYFVMQLV